VSGPPPAGAPAPADAVSVWRRRIELPRYLRKVHGGEQLRRALAEVIAELGFLRPRFVCGPTVTSELARSLASSLTGSLAGSPGPPLSVDDNSRAEVEALAASLAKADVVVAVGGGRTIDVAKAACEIAGLPVVVVPTQLTADGIASPVSVIRAHSGEVESGRARLPIGVVVDLDFVARSAPERVRAGLGDLVANACAVRDWRLAAIAGSEAVDDFAALLAQSASELVYGTDVGSLGEGRPAEALLERLLDGLVMSGIAMEIAGSSRPCSGSEHLVSHALDRLYPGTAQHGEQVAFGAVVCTRLQGADWRSLRSFLAAAGLERAIAGFRLSAEQLAAAVLEAPSTRPGRYTVLEEAALDERSAIAVVDEVLARP
jgi:glycerol-1-phosphate dehydrogenase [NAD(P)+]